MTTAIPIRKSPKISTTIRMDRDLHAQIQQFTREHHLDFSSFITLSAKQSIHSGIHIEPYYEISDRYARELDEIVEGVDRGEEKTYGPFEGKEAIAFLDSIK